MPINSFLYPGAKVPPPGYDVANSLRFDGSSSNLSRTQGSATNQKKGTISFWMKPSAISDDMRIITNYNDVNNHAYLRLNDDFQLQHYVLSGGSAIGHLKTTRLFRDFSAWYHIVLTIDTTQGTAANRMKLYVNGSQETAFATETYPDQNADHPLFAASASGNHFIGRHYNDADYWHGYLAEFVQTDGQALDPTSFGEFDSDSPTIWKPIDVSGLTFGNNGYYLDFEDSSALGNDVSGNDNDFTANNIAATDQSTDTCTNNFATFNSAQPALSNTSFSEGNLVVATNSSASTQVPFATTIPISTGKFYAEFKMIAKSTTSGSIPYIGVLGAANFVSELNNAYFVGGSNLDGVGYGASGVVYSNGSELDSSEASYDDDDIIGVAADITNKKIYFSKNGTYINSGDPAAGSNGYTIPTTSQGFYIFAASLYGASGSWGANFGSPSFSISSGNSDANGYGNFEYAVPSGYYALNTKNLAEFG
jgi:hypothetical protein|tara:strand:+ start:413 stop:1849 length:1437 start_codon:yes stop_codon:yes gene_type:complete